MRAKDIVMGNLYRIKPNLDYTWVRPIEILKPKQAPNTTNYIVVKCEHVVNATDIFGFVRYFKASDIVDVMKGVK